ncbi:MAG: hypothetical protein ACLRMJ_00340 [Alistipes finegoldii]
MKRGYFRCWPSRSSATAEAPTTRSRSGRGQRQHHGRRTDDGVGRPERRHLPLQLKPGKLITLKQVNTTNCKRAAAACASTSWRRTPPSSPKE